MRVVDEAGCLAQREHRGLPAALISSGVSGTFLVKGARSSPAPVLPPLAAVPIPSFSPFVTGDCVLPSPFC